MATQEEIEAGWKAAIPDLDVLTDTFVPDMFGYRQRIHGALRSDAQVIGIGHDAIKQVIEAVDHVRQGKKPPEPQASAAWDKGDWK
jgi:hypothetical protein